MSKSKGNVIDPLYVMDRYGTDAFRFTLAAFAAQGRDIRLSEERIEGYRHFINKLWNASRFSLMHLKAPFKPTTPQRFSDDSLVDRWILSRLRDITEKVTTTLDEYKFNEAAGVLYHFVWHEFCDWYLECIKPILYDDNDTLQQDRTRYVLWTVLHAILRLLHPFIPFVTEEIWHKLLNTNGSIMKATFPTAHPEHSDTYAEKEMALIMSLVTGIRNIRGEMNIPPSKFLRAVVESLDQAILATIERHRDIVSHLARLDEMTITSMGTRPDSAATAVMGPITVFIPLKGIINFEEEQRRLSKEIAKIDKELASITKKLTNEAFLKKAPSEIIEKAKSQKKLLSDKRNRLEEHLEKVRELRR